MDLKWLWTCPKVPNVSWSSSSLSAEEVAVRLAGSGSGPVLAPSQVAAIVERASGNPMFLRELLRAAGQAGSVEGLPESLEPLLATQIDLLSPSDRQVLRAAAVLGTHFDPSLLHELLEEGSSSTARCGTDWVPTSPQLPSVGDSLTA